MDNNDVFNNGIETINDDTKEINHNEIAIVAYPWRRYFARGLDLSIYELIWTAFNLLVLHWSSKSNLLITIFNTFLAIGMMLLIEPLLLSRWGSTLGKWVFGLEISNKDGSKLTYGQAFGRTYGVFGTGLGFNIPIYNIVRLVKCYSICKSLVPLPWEEDFSYSIRDTKIIRTFGYIGVAILIFVLNIIVLFQAELPIHRGDITARQYYDNCNDIINYNKLYKGISVNDQGEWEDNSASNIYNIDFFQAQTLPRHELTITNGIVTGVKLEVEIKTNEWISGYTIQKYIAFMSFVAAQKEMNFIRLRSSEFIKNISKDYENYSFIEAGVRVTNKVEYSGYSESNGQFLLPTEGLEQYFHMIFTMEKVGA
jgi:uncharacterized RDD family membrane protein YckC